LDNYYAPKYENGIIFDDSIFKIKWPKEVIVSKKDKKLLSFKNFKQKFKAI
jgi:dTDP-4-dehydrorhamnose 3,5-epimerase-like enzyme